LFRLNDISLVASVGLVMASSTFFSEPLGKFPARKRTYPDSR
jgi:hypothetical protein